MLLLPISRTFITAAALINSFYVAATQACCDLIMDAMFPYKRAITRSSSGIPNDALNLLQEPCKLLKIVTSCVKVLQPVRHSS